MHKKWPGLLFMLGVIWLGQLLHGLAEFSVGHALGVALMPAVVVYAIIKIGRYEESRRSRPPDEPTLDDTITYPDRPTVAGLPTRELPADDDEELVYGRQPVHEIDEHHLFLPDHGGDYPEHRDPLV